MMKFSILSDSLEKMELTSKRLELTDILVELLKKTILVLMGGISEEKEISILSKGMRKGTKKKEI